ncbi:MAG: FG-GAP repeat protein [Deltaproteobacteria bacterium]|nr:FG-GAP repeat protein [Deltaproteobacteria bacterium]
MVGAVYLAARSGTTWTYTHYVKAPNADAGDTFGWALALSGDGTTLAVGAPGEDGVGDAAPNCGEAYVFY